MKNKIYVFLVSSFVKYNLASSDSRMIEMFDRSTNEFKVNEKWKEMHTLIIIEVKILTRPGVQQCQAQGQVFCPWLGLI